MEAERILIADDDEALLHLMAFTLKREGYQVVGASEGFSALETLRSQGPFSVLVTDLMMPDINGLELMREARQCDPELEVIMITAAGSLETAISALRADGAYDYLLKPLESMDQLSLAVERAIRHRRLRLEREDLYNRVQNDADRLWALIANTADAILSADENSTITIANPAATRLLGRDDLVGQAASECLPAQLASLVTNWQTVSSRHPAVLEVPWKDNTVQMVNLTPLINNGNWGGWVMVLRDITHFKNLDELKAQMLNEAANKIRYPLVQAVNALAELDLLASQDERISGIVYRLTKVWSRIQEWVDDLPTLIQLDSGLNIRLVDVNLTAMIESLRQELTTGRMRDRGLNLTVNITDQLPAVRADANLLKQLIQGLINRAMMRSKRGGEVRLAARVQQNQVWLDVSDDGSAVSEEDLPHLFEKSVIRLDASPENTGLELALAKAILDRIGGQVWIGGQGPIGGTITVCLPSAVPPDAGKT
jgi:PAS domain S-box-containing protein